MEQASRCFVFTGLTREKVELRGLKKAGFLFVCMPGVVCICCEKLEYLR